MDISLFHLSPLSSVSLYTVACMQPLRSEHREKMQNTTVVYFTKML